MGYTTWFNGSFEISDVISNDLVEYINKFSETRRMKRSNEEIKKLDPEWEKHCLNGKLGEEGEFYISPVQDDFRDKSILDINNPPYTQPGLWCNWIVEKGRPGERSYIVWNEAEKFYHYEQWLQYYINNFLRPEGLHLTGEMEFEGEDKDDNGIIDIVTDDDGNDHVRMRYYERILDDSHAVIL